VYVRIGFYTDYRSNIGFYPGHVRSGPSKKGLHSWITSYLSPLGRPALRMSPCMFYSRCRGEIWVEGPLRPPSEGRPAVDPGLPGQLSVS